MAIRKIVSRSLGDGTVNKQELDVSASGAGTGAAILPSGTTGQRPGSAAEGMIRYNTTLGIYEQYTAAGWVGIAAPPIVSSTDVNNVDESATTQTIVISGSNFDSTATAVLVTSSGTIKTPTTSTRNSATQITITYSGADLLISSVPEPLDVKVTNGSGLFASLVGAINIDATPAWSSPSAGSIATIYEGTAMSAVTLSATDSEGSSVSYSVTSGALPTGVTISTNTISGTSSAGGTYASAGTTFNFTVSASDGTGNTTPRAFSILRKWNDGSTSTQFATSAATIKSLTSTTTNGFYWIKTTGMANPVQLWCDMNIDGGGYMRFWWHGRFEIDGSSPSSYPSGDAFGTADISTIAYDATTGFGRIPAGLTPSKLLAKGGGGAAGTYQAKTAPLAYATWSFSSGNSTSNAVLASMQSGTTARFGASTQWSCDNLNTSNTNVSTLKTPNYTGSENPGSGSMDSWYYDDTNSPSGSGKGFQLDDDGGFFNTTIGAGSDSSGNRGVDFFSWQEPVLPTNVLILYWK